MSYPVIYLSESNPEIEDCTVLHALKDLFIRIRLRDGHEWDYVEVTDYSEGLLWFTFVADIASSDDEGFSYQVMVPVSAIESITYI